MLAVLNRDNLARIILDQPMLGAKILRELTLMLSRRLRAATDQLVELSERHGENASDLPRAYGVGRENGHPV